MSTVIEADAKFKPRVMFKSQLAEELEMHRHTLMRKIYTDDELYSELCALGYKRKQKLFTKRQTEVIHRLLG